MRRTMEPNEREEQTLRLAAALRDACAEVASKAYEQAAMSGLCCEGAWECAMGALRSFDVSAWLASRREGMEERREG